MRIIAIALCCAAVSACGPFVYKIEVQQGNYVTTDVVEKVKVGQTKAEVRQVLGTPLLNDIFHADRWDYYFSSGRGSTVKDKKRFTVVFKDDKVVSFEGDAHPPGPAPVGRLSPPGER
jgi:outer membrane protein assembly factor BamE